MDVSNSIIASGRRQSTLFFSACHVDDDIFCVDCNFDGFSELHFLHDVGGLKLLNFPGQFHVIFKIQDVDRLI